ncbi:N-acetylglucosamine kinase 1 [Elasticomyces elasticus]|uniref:Phosphotransferase n=1 Tax=Elasticomyces elasticus TaxID=574655 RepID=A0AAN8A2E6_9PEZI|nr:N-acetylglucosamine kinase 1 [Elasticomyces elasticus]
MQSAIRYCFCFAFQFWISSKLGLAMSTMIASTIRLIRPPQSNKRKRSQNVVSEKPTRTMDACAAEVRDLLRVSLEPQQLLDMSDKLQLEYRAKLEASEISMLPSYLHTLPTGRETGDFLALDVGGSTFRIALIRLGKDEPGRDGLQVRRIRSFVIGKAIRDLKGRAFFDWMAERIGDMLAEYNHIKGTTDANLQMGLAWSFPIEQTSPRSGKLLAMGKGFCATHGVEGQDLSELIMHSCRARNLNVDMRAIVNDGAATLLSQAYRDPTTLFLPCSALGTAKFGIRPSSWHAAAEHVLVNTEISMFGRHVFPRTRWDDELNSKHVLPDFQPLEYMITGRYLGEIARLILVEAITTAGLFSGEMPEKLCEPYALDTRILAGFQTDTSRTMSKASAAFLDAHALPSQPRLSELHFIREIAQLISRRAATYLATALHALWAFRMEAEELQPCKTSHITVACDGTIIEKYPEFRAACQRQLDELCILSGASKGAVSLAMAPESSLFGAAVAVSCIADD